MTVSAPYNFVPLSPHVCTAADLGLSETPSQDSPEKGALSGSIDFTITCEGPILVSWGEPHQDKVKRFGKTPDGTPAIPGSTLRGMIRNVLEIASFGKMALVDDQRTSVRDLNPSARLDYGSRVSEVVNGAYLPKARAGWLRLDGRKLVISPCEFARIDHSDLSAISPGFRQEVRNRLRAYNKSTDKKRDAHNDMSRAENVQAVFTRVDPATGASPALRQRLWVQTSVDRHAHRPVNGRDKVLMYRRAAQSPDKAERLTDHDPGGTLKAKASEEPGTLVFTGMPADTKHMEFFFLDGRAPDLDVPPEVWKGFLDVHERQEKVSETWKWRKADLHAGQEVPVFYLADGAGEVTHLGLALMFKLPADHSIGTMIDHASTAHRQSGTVDLAERIFGRLETGPGASDGWRGRVSFGWAGAVDGYEEPDNRDVQVVMAKPKPGFPAAYVRQVDFADTTGTRLIKGEVQRRNGAIQSLSAQYRSYMGASGSRETIRGWKRYPVGPERLQAVPAAAGESVSRLRPLRPQHGSTIRFAFKLRYHNLAPVELGALIWAATFGGDPSRRHAIGMGRPLGWGQVMLSADLSGSYALALQAYVERMEAWATDKGVNGGWKGSIQVQQLCAMADPRIGQGQARVLRQMKIVIGEDNGNDFVAAKKLGAILPEYALDDLSPWWAGPSPNALKIQADASVDTRRSIQEEAQSVAGLFRAGRERYAEARLTEKKAEAGREKAAESAGLFPPGAKVFVDQETVSLVVLELDGNTYRIVSKRADGTGRQKIAVRRLRDAP